MSCDFITERMHVGEAVNTQGKPLTADALAGFLQTLLVPSVTAELPPGWQGSYDRARALAWLAERRNESELVFLQEANSGALLGVLILFADGDDAQGRRTYRIGYLLHPEHWGRGLASELIAGLVSWAQSARVGALLGGVTDANVASQRVMQKAGFSEDPQQRGDGEQVYVWRAA